MLEREEPGLDAAGFVYELEQDYRTMALADGDRAVLDYAMALTRTPERISATDVQRLRDHGLDDRAIHDLATVTAYFAFVNRIADGLGVELEEQTPD